MPADAVALPPHVRAFLAGTDAATIATLDHDGAPRSAVARYRLQADGRILVKA